MKFMKLTLFAFAIAFIFTVAQYEEAQAVGYDIELTGVLLYLSKAEATNLAHTLENTADNGTRASIVMALLPSGVPGRVAAAVTNLMAVHYRSMARDLLRCSNRGATVKIHWPILGPLTPAFPTVKNR